VGAIAYDRGQRGEPAGGEGPLQIWPEGGLELLHVRPGGPLGAPLGDLPAHRYWVLGNGQSLSAQRNGDGRVRIYLSFYNTAEDWFATSGIPFDHPAAARARLTGLLTGWDPRFTALIAACDDMILPRSITTLPVGLTWPSTPGVTLLGDAAHLMPPVGQGANMALLDGALLGLALAAHPDDFPGAVKEYEREMFERTSAVGRQSARVQEILTSPDANQKMLAFFRPA
jgi:2-polyprenyl-6-methoxyphenol hydroxylase-like FAD-dependent oxidoreductase